MTTKAKTENHEVCILSQAHYNQLAQEAALGVEGLNAKEKLAVLELRLHEAAVQFVLKRGSGEVWSRLIGCMAAIKKVH